MASSTSGSIQLDACLHAGGSADLKWPADVYLEGSDQHRGWFHPRCSKAAAPGAGRPTPRHPWLHMDKRGANVEVVGNTVVPQDVIKQSGADILRLWVVTTDYWEDQRLARTCCRPTFGPYRKLRKTIRWMLARSPMTMARRCRWRKMPELERLMLHRAGRADEVVASGYDAFDQAHHPRTARFHVVELSALLLRHPQGRALCERSFKPEAQGLGAGGAPSLRLPGEWLGAMCPSPWRRPGSTVTPMRCRCNLDQSRKSRPIGRRGAGGEMAQGAAGAPRSSPARWRSRAPRGDRLVARSGAGRDPRRCCARSGDIDVDMAEMAITSDLVIAHGKARKAPSRSTTSRVSPCASRRPRPRIGQNARVHGAIRPMSGRTPIPRCFARDAAVLHESSAWRLSACRPKVGSGFGMTACKPGIAGVSKQSGISMHKCHAGRAKPARALPLTSG